MDNEEQTIQTLPPEEAKEAQRSAGSSQSWMQHPLLVPLSVIVAGAMIAVAIFLNDRGASAKAPSIASADQMANSLSEAAKKMRPVDENDHVLGDPNAPVTIVEYSDFQCPYCASFHPTIKQILADFDGKVRWVYRHFPLSQIHPEALSAAIASECVARLGGNAAFSQFVDGVFADQRQVGKALYERLAQKAGVNLASFRTCLESPDIAKRVSDDLENGIVAGGNGTPYSIVVNAKGEVFPFSGALPYAQVKQLIEQALDADI